MVVIYISLVLLPCSGSALAAETVHINTSIKPPFSTLQQTGFFDLLLRELFTRVDREVELMRLPAERALLMADKGVSDGDVPRIAGLEKRYDNLVPVPEAIIDYRFVAFMREHVESGITWDMMRQYKVGMVIGWKIYEENVPAGSRLTKVSSAGQLIDMLGNSRLDIALYERYAGKYLINKKQLPLQESSPPLAIKPMYLYLHKSRADLVEPLADALRGMKDDGTWQRIADQTLGE